MSKRKKAELQQKLGHLRAETLQSVEEATPQIAETAALNLGRLIIDTPRKYKLLHPYQYMREYMKYSRAARHAKAARQVLLASTMHEIVDEPATESALPVVVVSDQPESAPALPPASAAADPSLQSAGPLFPGFDSDLR
jgi:hypothetical protein